MPLAINNTPNDPNANSYASESDVDAYSLTTAYAASWAKQIAGSDAKLALILRACLVLEYESVFVGLKATNAQARDFPRLFVFNSAGFYYLPNQVPPCLVEAQSLLACWLSSRPASEIDPFGLDQVAQIADMKVGPIALTFRADVGSPGPTFFASSITPILERGMVVSSGSRLTR